MSHQVHVVQGSLDGLPDAIELLVGLLGYEAATGTSLKAYDCVLVARDRSQISVRKISQFVRFATPRVAVPYQSAVVDDDSKGFKISNSADWCLF